MATCRWQPGRGEIPTHAEQDRPPRDVAPARPIRPGAGPNSESSFSLESGPWPPVALHRHAARMAAGPHTTRFTDKQ